MKKIIALLISLMVVMMIAAGCASSGKNAEPPSTVADMDKYEFFGYGYNEAYYVYIYKDHGVYYRAIVKLPEDVSKELSALGWDDPDQEQKMKELVGPLAITKWENISEQILPQDELDQLTGKTGEDLLNDGWEAGGIMADGSKVSMEYGLFQYTVTFDKEIVESEDLTTEDLIRPLTVESVVYLNISSDALSVED